MPKALVAALAGLGLVGSAAAQDDAPDDAAPELDFLEYLGSWQETDEEWLIVSEWEDDDESSKDKRPEPERKDDEE